MGEIPEDKKYFRIGEVSRIIGVRPYVLRYWESEFPQIRPHRADSKQRTYQKKDLEVIFGIKKLLYEEKLTIEGARRRLKAMKSEKRVSGDQEFLREMRKELQEILRALT
ncbi:MAG: MerR family transcriptional regulator [Deltaproteobacteria bacterium]|nr:MerR family transcriptional regulator [Deltaproteobacteria bacterium]